MTGVAGRVAGQSGDRAGAGVSALVAPGAGADTLTLVPSGEALGSPALRGCWATMLGGVNRLNRLYASPDWFEHLSLTEPNIELFLGVLKDEVGQVVGVCPVAVRDVPLSYDVASRVITRNILRGAVILGDEPMLPPLPGAYRRLLGGLFERLPSLQCVYISALPLEGFAGRVFRGEWGASRDYFSYLPYGNRPWFWIELGAGFEEYLGTMSGKARYNLRRQVRELGKTLGGAPELIQVDSVGQIGEFAEQVARISARSWQHRVLGPTAADTDRSLSAFRDLARRGILRSFLLRCGPEPCAFVVGYQFDGVYYYAQVGYNETLGHLSPGTSLLYLLLEALFRKNTPWALNFGIGDAVYKRRFANRQISDASVFLLRRGLGNRLRWSSHRAFQAGVNLTKRLLHRTVEK